MRNQDIEEIVHGHLAWWENQEEEQRLFEGAYETLFWQTHQYEDARGLWHAAPQGSVGDGLPVKLEAPRLWTWTNTFTSHLFLRQPRCVARLPGVLSPKAGRPRDLRELPERVEALVDEWLGRSDVQALATYGYQLALLGGAAAFKLGVEPGAADILDRVWLTVAPRWECVWDDRAAHPHQQLFRGHLCHILDSEAERLIGGLPKGWERSRLPGLFVDNRENLAVGDEDKIHPQRYVRLLELYDFEDEQQKFYLVSGDAKSPSVVAFGEPEKFPYTWPSGKPACPLFPLVLDNTPKFPMRGIPSARRIWRMSAEDNYLGSYIASAARQRMALKGLFDKSLLSDPKFGEFWRSGANLELFGVDNVASTERVLKFLEIPPLDKSLGEAKAWIDQSRRETEGTSPQMQGVQGQYLTAKEAELVAEGGEATSLQIASRMVNTLAKVAEMLLVVVAAAEKRVQIVRGAKISTLTREDLRLPWRLSILDAGTTPSREASRKREWGLIEPMVEKLVTIASAPDAPEQVQRYARAALGYTRQVYDLPEPFSPEALLDGVAPKPPAEAPPLDVPIPAPALVSPPAALPPVPPELAAPPVAPPSPVVAAAPSPPPPPATLDILTDPVTGAMFDAATGALVDPTTGQLIPLPPEGATA